MRGRESGKRGPRTRGPRLGTRGRLGDADRREPPGSRRTERPDVGNGADAYGVRSGGGYLHSRATSVKALRVGRLTLRFAYLQSANAPASLGAVMRRRTMEGIGGKCPERKGKPRAERIDEADDEQRSARDEPDHLGHLGRGLCTPIHWMPALANAATSSGAGSTIATRCGSTGPAELGQRAEPLHAELAPRAASR